MNLKAFILQKFLTPGARAGRRTGLSLVCARILGFAVPFGIFALQGCNPEGKQLYQLTELRVPVAQLFTKETPTPGKVCKSFEANATEVYCQQFPVRPGTEVVLSFVAISPPGESPSFSITKVSQITGQGLSGTGLRGGTGQGLGTAGVPLSTFGLVDAKPNNATLSLVRQQAPLRIEQFAYTLKIPSIEELARTVVPGGGVPGYSVAYEVVSSSRTERGEFTFYVLPAPEDEAAWAANGATGRGLLPETVLAELKVRAKANVAPYLSGVVPASGTAIPKSDTTLEVVRDPNAPDADAGAKERYQWFVTAGDVVNERARKTTWTPKSEGQVGVFVVVRDLQGGVDYAYATYDAK